MTAVFQLMILVSISSYAVSIDWIGTAGVSILEMIPQSLLYEVSAAKPLKIVISVFSRYHTFSLLTGRWIISKRGNNTRFQYVKRSPF